MKKLILLMVMLNSFTAFAAEGKAVTKANQQYPSAREIDFDGSAAREISKDLSNAGVRFFHNGGSGGAAQQGKGISCVEKNDSGADLYCYILVQNGAVVIE